MPLLTESLLFLETRMIRVKVRPLFDYCQKKGVEPSELSSEEMEQFLQY